MLSLDWQFFTRASLVRAGRQATRLDLSLSGSSATPTTQGKQRVNEWRGVAGKGFAVVLLARSGREQRTGLIARSCRICRGLALAALLRASESHRALFAQSSADLRLTG